MDTIQSIENEIKEVDIWISAWVNGVVKMNLKSTERLIRRRRLAISRLQKIQIREFRRG